MAYSNTVDSIITEIQALYNTKVNSEDIGVVISEKKILDAVEDLTGRKVSGRDIPDIKKIFGASLQ